MKINLKRGFENAVEETRRRISLGHIPCAVLAVAGANGSIQHVHALNQKAEDDSSLKKRIFTVASITKAIVGVGIARLVDQGVLAYSDPVVKYLPEFDTAPWRRKVRVGDIFTHTTGLSPLGTIDWVEALVMKKGRDVSPFKTAPLYKTGAKMAYTTLTYQVLNQMIRKCRNQGMEDFLKEYVFRPCGMVHTTFDPGSNPLRLPSLNHPMKSEANMRAWSKAEVSGGGLWSTASDLIKFGQALLKPGYLMSPKIMKLHTDAQPGKRRLNTTMTSCRTWGWNREPHPEFKHAGKSGFYHGGACETLLWIDPKRKLIFVFLSNYWKSSNDAGFAALNCLYK